MHYSRQGETATPHNLNAGHMSNISEQIEVRPQKLKSAMQIKIDLFK
jgi:hypothetical protein